MGKIETVKYVCDVCGKDINGDFMTVTVDNREFIVCLPRTAALNPCGNQTKKKLLAIFGEQYNGT